MLTIAIFLFAVAVVWTTNALFGPLDFADTTLWLWANIFFQLLLSGACALLFCKILPKNIYASDKRLSKTLPFEKKLYNFLRVKKWKDRVLDTSKISGFSKKNLSETPSAEYLEKFVREANSGWVEHVASAILGFALVFACPKDAWLTIGLPVAAISALLNLMPVCSLRYTIPRLLAALKMQKRKEERAANA